jgi:Sensory domain in DIguanylate Cyclases and Two-component system
MFAQTKAESKTAKNFLPKLKKHLNGCAAGHAAIRLGHCEIKCGPTLAERVQIPARDIIHVFEPETMLAVSHAIEDLASETRCGELISTFQKFTNFLPQKKRYLSLAQDLDAVRVWGAGEKPKGCPGIDFIVANDPKIVKYWLVLFESPENHAVLVCKQVNKSTVYADKKFIGFYSFNPYLVQSIRWRFNLLSSGLDKIMRHWDKSMMLPDLKFRDLDKFLGSEKKAIAPRRH